MNVPADEEKAGLHAPRKPNRTRLLGMVLLVAAVMFWVAAPAVVFFPLPAGQKVWAGSAFLVMGEVAFLVAALVLGREVVRRYRRFLDPRSWFGKGRG
jgi:Kef-type K+ transport system membrane component KefB